MSNDTLCPYVPQRIEYIGKKSEGLSESSAMIEVKKRTTSRPEYLWGAVSYQATESVYPHRQVLRWKVVGVAKSDCTQVQKG